MIEIENLVKSYNKGQVQAVRDLSLRVETGEIFGFLGPNGAGKSTTIKTLVGLLQPDSGTIRVQGMDVGRNALQAKRIIGYVPDEPVLYEKMSGARFLRFIADIWGLSEQERRRIDELAETFEMTEALGEVVSGYSHGMRQKLSIIAALLHNPEVFILDEPIVGLDPRAAFRLKETMRSRCEAGKTVFFSTHVMEVAEKICDRVGIIRDGRIIALGRLEELRHKAGTEDASLERLFLDLTEEKSYLG